MELAVQLGDDYDVSVEIARWAERRGLGAFAVPDHYLYGKPEDGRPAPEALIQLAGLARDTHSIELVSLVSPITFRHPSVFVKSAIDIDRMSGGGRFALGLGAGWHDDEHTAFGIPYPERAERFTLLEEALAYVRAAVNGNPEGYRGEFFRLEKFPIAPAPKGKIKLVVGGAGPVKTPRLAGTYADEFNVYSRPLDVMEERIERAAEAAVRAGRDPAEIFISTACPPVIGADQAEYEEALERAAEVFRSPRDQVEGRLAEAGIVHGTPERLAEQLGGFAGIGVRRYYAQTLHKDRSIARFEHVFGLLEEAAR